MACGALTSRSSGGRSAVQASSGTPARSASTTAGCSSAVAVPLVVSTTAGRPVARPSPSARNPPERSSCCTWRRTPGWSAGPAPAGSARPGAHDRIGEAVAHPLVDQRGREGRLYVVEVIHRQESLAVRLHSEREGMGLPLVLLHGFGQTAGCWGALPGALVRDYEVVRLGAPGHGATGGEE